MKLFTLFIILIFLSNCSFDNKTGIWTNDSILSKSEIDILKDFETLSSSSKTFNQVIEIDKAFNFSNKAQNNNAEWKDVYFNKSNNYDNFKYNNLNQLQFKSSKISNQEVGKFILYVDDKVILSNKKGDLIIYSLFNKKIKSKFNFYKKRFKNIEKKLYLIEDNNIIFVTDNIGYIYAFDINKNRILWAKDYKVPFRSNLKIFNEKLIASNQNNNLFFFNKKTGDLLKKVPTEENIVKNDFVSNISLNNKYTFFLNTYGSLYAIDNETMKIIWFLNLNQSLDLNPSNLFKGSEIICNNKIVIISANQFTYFLDINSGSIIYKKNFTTSIKPIIINNYFFTISKKNLLIAVNLNNGKIIYSYNVNTSIADFLKTKEKTVQFKSLMMADDKIFVFLNNSYILKFNIKGNLINVEKLPTKINTYPIFVKGSLVYLDKKNKISVIN